MPRVFVRNLAALLAIVGVFVAVHYITVWNVWAGILVLILLVAIMATLLEEWW